jgi:glycosyltransferase involved in cell wall biosynthesis
MADYSVIIPAYNEEKLLGETLVALTSAMREFSDFKGEIIVVDNNSTDKTAEIAQEHGAKVVFESVNQISRARNAGGNAAASPFLIFLDADTLISAELLGKAVDNMRSGKICGGGTLIKFDSEIPSYGNFLLKTFTWLSLKFKMAAGCFVYSLKNAFDETGGFSRNVYAGEELLFSRNIRRWGKRHSMDFVIIEGPGIKTSSRKLEWHSPWKILWFTLFIGLFPIALRSRKMCSFWYTRPKSY